jgi:hypothetical protein
MDAFMQRQTTGSSLHVVAPAGDLYSISNNIVAKSGGGCDQITAGSSFAGPVVSGIVGKRLAMFQRPMALFLQSTIILAQLVIPLVDNSTHVTGQSESGLARRAGHTLRDIPTGRPH